MDWMIYNKTIQKIEFMFNLDKYVVKWVVDQNINYIQ